MPKAGRLENARPMTQSSFYFALSSRLPSLLRFHAVTRLMRRVAVHGLRTFRFPIQLVLVLGLAATAAEGSELKGIRSHESPDKVRLVMDLSAPVEHTLFTLDEPKRVVIDILDTDANSSRFRDRKWLSTLTKGPVKSVRLSPETSQNLRVVLELKGIVKPKSFLLRPIGQYGDRLVVDLLKAGEKAVLPAAREPMAPPKSQSARDVVIAIDAGHGGDDPGAIGPKRIYEKTVVLAIAKALQREANRHSGYQAILTRGGDYYLAHRERTAIAREHQADVFISIHADAWKTPDARGASVYAISESGATSETARWLAESENRADLIGGVGSVSLDDKDDVLAEVLLDLSMTASLSSSIQIGEFVLAALKPFNRLHKKRVEQASFIVLKSPDIPSILVETGFISNPGEAARLATRSHQEKLARAIFKGVDTYFSNYPPPGTMLAARSTEQSLSAITYKIKRGDTLSEIAERFQVSSRQIKEANALRTDTIRIGQVLEIPRT